MSAMRRQSMTGIEPGEPVSWMEQFAHRVTTSVGSSWAFVVALAMTVLWLVSGPLFHYSDTWQLVMNTISSIVTFLMVFLLQRSQNKDSLAMQIKLNEILGAIRGASNLLINVEDLPEDQVRALHERYHKLCEKAKANGNMTGSLSIEQSAGGARPLDKS